MVPVCEQRMLIPIHLPVAMSRRGVNNVHSPNRDPTIDQSDNTTKLQLGEATNTLVLPTGTWMTQRQPHHQKLTPTGMAAHKSWNPGALCMASRKLSMLECLLSSAALNA